MARLAESWERNRKAACRLLEEWGIDPERVAQDGHDETGYDSFVYKTDSDEFKSKAVSISGAALKVHVPWPTGFPYRAFEILAP